MCFFQQYILNAIGKWTISGIKLYLETLQKQDNYSRALNYHSCIITTVKTTEAHISLIVHATGTLDLQHYFKLHTNNRLS